MRHLTFTVVALTCGLLFRCSSDAADRTGDCDAPCEVLSQCGCSEGLMCSLVNTATSEIACVGEGANERGEPCSLGSCRPGLHCAGVNGLPATCRPWCSPTAEDDGCGSGGCILDIGELTVKLCGDSCDPLTDAGCTLANTKCLPTEGGSLCLAIGPLGEGAACSDQTDCGPGLNCFQAGPDTEPHCRAYCLEGGAACPPDRTCETFSTGFTVDDQPLGACVPL